MHREFKHVPTKPEGNYLSNLPTQCARKPEDKGAQKRVMLDSGNGKKESLVFVNLSELPTAQLLQIRILR